MRAILLLLLFPLSVLGQTRQITADVINGQNYLRNYVKNPSGFTNTANVSTSSAAVSRDTDSADAIDGIASLICDASSQNGYCAWSLNTIAEGDKTGNCEFKLQYKGDASLYKLRVTDTTNTIADSAVLTNSTDWKLASVNAPCASSRDVRFVQTEAGTGAAVNVGRVYWGPATNLSQVAQPTLWAKATWAATSGCAWSSTQNVAFANFAADTDCPNPTVVGYAAAAGTKIPGFTLTSLPRGNYVVVFTGAPYGTAGTNTNGYMRVTDGTNVSNTCLAWSGGTIAGSGGCTFSFTNSSNLSSVTLQLQSMTSGSGGTPTLNIFAEGTATQNGGALELAVYRYPSFEETAATLADGPYFTEWTSWTPTGSWSSNTTYVGRWRRVADTAEYDVAVDTSGAPNVTTLSINLPSGHVIDTAKLASTTDNQLQSSGATNPATSNQYPANVQYNTTTSVLATALIGSASTNVRNAISDVIPATFGAGGTVRVSWKAPIVGWKAPSGAAPILVGSVSSNTSAQERHERAEINCDASSSITSQSGSWLSAVGNRSSTACTITIATGIFSAAPACTFTAKATTVQATSVNMTSATAGTVYGASADYDGYLNCTGPR